MESSHSCLLMNGSQIRQVLECANPLACRLNIWPVQRRQRTAAVQDAGAPGPTVAGFTDFLRGILRTTLSLLLLGAGLGSSVAQELAVAVESPAFALDTRLPGSGGATAQVVEATSPAFTLDTRPSAGSTLSDTVMTVESPAFALDTRLAGRLDALIVRSVSPTFEVNTMWLGIRRTGRTAGSPVELYWPTNAPGFYPQSALPPLQPLMLWRNMTNAVNESGGLYRSQFSPDEPERYFRLKL
jgi:hypothetical protein